MVWVSFLCDYFDCQPGAILSYEKEIDENSILFRLREEQARSIYETQTIGVTEGYEKVDDIIETVNHFRCFDYILSVADKELSEDIAKHIHLLLKSGTTDSQKEYFFVLCAKLFSSIV